MSRTCCSDKAGKEVADDKEVAALCHNSGTIHCDGCKKKLTIKHVGPPGKGLDKIEVTIVNAEGEQCMFIVPMTE